MRVVRHHSGNEYAVGDIDEVVMMRVVTSESPLLMIMLFMIMLMKLTMKEVPKRAIECFCR